MRTILEAFTIGLIITALAGAIIYETNQSVNRIKQAVLHTNNIK